MGENAYSIDTIWEQRPTVKAYTEHVKGDVKAFVDDVITTGIKPNNVLRVDNKKVLPTQDDFWQLRWIDIIMLRNAIQNSQMLEAMQVVYQFKPKDFFTLDVFNCFAVYKWITEQLSEIAKAEENELASDPSSEEKAAGVEQLEEFDYAVSLDVIAGGDVLKYDAILEQPYAVIFRKLCLEKTKNEIQQNLIENAYRKTKTGF